MSNILHDLSEKIEPWIVEMLRAVGSAADSLGIPFFVVGAEARDILFLCYGLTTSRKTEDIDIGVQVSTWSEFERLFGLLQTDFGFEPTRMPHRLRFRGRILDMVPHGLIAGADRRIRWPSHHGLEMNVLGFDDAYENSILIRLSSSPQLDIRFSNLPGLAVMKIISWRDKYPERKKDAQDLSLMMETYESAGNFDRLYREEQALLEEEDFEPNLAGARLLGIDITMVASDDTFTMVLSVLQDEKWRDKLILDMRKTALDNYQSIEKMVERVIKGLQEGKARGNRADLKENK